jgi:hypothetical protein
MQQLIISYQIGDDCTWSARETFPILYESQEALYVHFSEAIKRYVKAETPEHRRELWEVEFDGRKFDIADFAKRVDRVKGKQHKQLSLSDEVIEAPDGTYMIEMPEILTVDEWFGRLHLL